MILHGNETGQTLMPESVTPNPDNGLLHAHVCLHSIPDRIGLDANAAYFYLLIPASQIVEVTVLIYPAQITDAEPAALAVLAVKAQEGSVMVRRPVTPRQARPGDMNDARASGRDRQGEIVHKSHVGPVNGTPSGTSFMAATSSALSPDMQKYVASMTSVEP